MPAQLRADQANAMPLHAILHSVLKITPPRKRPAIWATGIGLAILSLCAALPIHPQGPFDARDFTRVPGAHLTQSGWPVLIEPLTAPLQILAGAPDHRLAGVAILLWVLCGAAAWRAFSDWQTVPGKSIRVRATRAALTGGAAAMLLVYCVGFAGVLRLPGWCLVADDPNALILDPHSHTVASRDGLVSGPENLNWHSSAGFNVVAITEHKRPAAASAIAGYVRSVPPPAPTVLAGVEISYNVRGVSLIGLGLRPDYLPLTDVSGQDYPARFASYVHDAQHGAVIAMAYKLEPDDVTRLANAGIDGFELVNFGHPNIPYQVHDTLLDVASKRGLALVAVSDWHGWGGLSRTWTLIQNPPGSGTSPESPADLTIRKLRERHTGNVIPVVAGYLGTPSWWRILLAPLVESLRYAAELSPARVVSWWLWSAVVLALAHRLSRAGLPPHKVLVAVLLAVIGISLVGAGAGLIAERANPLSSSTFPVRIGIYTLLVGVSALLVSAWLGVSSWSQRER